MSLGQALAARREERGLSIEQVATATRVRAEYLRALESDEIGRVVAPVYAKGYLRAYATYLGLDADQLTSQLPRGSRPGLEVRLGVGLPRPHVVVTTPMIAAAAVVLLAGAFGGYAWRQVVAEQRAAAGLPSPPPGAVTAGTPSASPAVQARPIVVGVHVTETVWINAVVDGTPQYGDSGRTLPAGSVVYFTGLDVKITSGKSSVTMISIDGRNLGAMGVGVATREFSSQTSP
jgi:cytoskeleton protein RodZ